MPRIPLLLLAVPLLLLVSCFSEPTASAEEGEEYPIELTLHVTGATRTGEEFPTRLDIALFDAAGNKLLKLNQLSTDPDFLQPTIRVPEGDLRFVLIAHSGAGVATITSPAEVTFPKNKVTDTFVAYLPVTITPDSPASLEVQLTRSVAMVRVILTDTELPADFAQLQFYYTGGSSTYCPQTGFGSVNSRQTEVRTLAESTLTPQGYHLFEIYSFPHILEDELKLTLTPQDAQGQPIAPDRIIESIPLHLNAITECRGQLFTSGTNASTSLTITLLTDWSEILHHDF